MGYGTAMGSPGGDGDKTLVVGAAIGAAAASTGTASAVVDAALPEDIAAFGVKRPAGVGTIALVTLSGWTSAAVVVVAIPLQDAAFDAFFDTGIDAGVVFADFVVGALCAGIEVIDVVDVRQGGVCGPGVILLRILVDLTGGAADEGPDESHRKTKGDKTSESHRCLEEMRIAATRKCQSFYPSTSKLGSECNLEGDEGDREFPLPMP